MADSSKSERPTVTCPDCGEEFEVDEAHPEEIRRGVTCRYCKHKFGVPVEDLR